MPTSTVPSGRGLGSATTVTYREVPTLLAKVSLRVQKVVSVAAETTIDFPSLMAVPTTCFERTLFMIMMKEYL